MFILEVLKNFYKSIDTSQNLKTKLLKKYFLSIKILNQNNLKKQVLEKNPFKFDEILFPVAYSKYNLFHKNNIQMKSSHKKRQKKCLYII